MVHSHDAIALLLAILESPAPVISEEARAISEQEARTNFLDCGLLVLDGYETSTTAIDDDSDRPVQVVPKEDGGGYRYYSSTAGWIDVEPGRLRRYKVDIHALMLALAPAETRLTTKSNATLLEDVLWSVGTFRVGSQTTDILYARRLLDAEVEQQVRAFLDNHPSNNRRVLLTSTDPARLSLIRFGETAIVSIKNVLGLGADARIDAHALAPSSKSVAPDVPLGLSEDGRELRILGSKFTFAGGIQRRLIALLVEGHRNGSPIETSTLLSEARSGATSLPKAFGSAKWKNLKKYLKKHDGRWRFEL